MKNEMEICFDAISSNESLARVAAAAFAAQLDPTLEELADIKTAVSEAVTNAIIHGYGNVAGYRRHGEVSLEAKSDADGKVGKVRMRCKLENGVLKIVVEDQGKGIEDIQKAMEPLFTTRPDLERSGMGFAFMEAFMDDLQVESAPGVGTIVRMQKKMTAGPWIITGE
ncbi:MAG: anti-sigma F factor [Lachnospiraceae bacterium]|nr:anti-sigma F factor [Lachnospiraceae bacterium]